MCGGRGLRIVGVFERGEAVLYAYVGVVLDPGIYERCNSVISFC
jgi:hypothetical protein